MLSSCTCPKHFVTRSSHEILSFLCIFSSGSNSVNVFLGLGLPWVISTCYHAVKKTRYIVYSGNITFSVVVFTTFGLVCILTLVIRRVVSILHCSLLLLCSNLISKGYLITKCKSEIQLHSSKKLNTTLFNLVEHDWLFLWGWRWRHY